MQTKHFIYQKKMVEIELHFYNKFLFEKEKKLDINKAA